MGHLEIKWNGSFSIPIGISFSSGAIAAFANFLPEIMELLGNRPKYAGAYKVPTLTSKFVWPKVKYK